MTGEILKGAEGEISIVIDGRVYETVLAEEIDAKIEIDTEEKNHIGKRGVRTLTTTYKCSGTLKMKYGNNALYRMFYEFMKTERMPVIQIIASNTPKSEKAIPINVVLHDVTFTSADLFKANAENDALSTEFPFVFSKADLLNGGEV